MGLQFDPRAPQVVFLHGGGQNAHTWDTVILGLGLPALAVDLPGHGRSAWREDGDYGPKLNAETLRPVLREWAPAPRLVVGMSLGGLTALRLAATEPALVPELVLVDVTPSAPERHEQMTQGPDGRRRAGPAATAPSPASPPCSTSTVAAAPHRDRNSLRRGVFHNCKQLDDGTWTWRYDSFRKGDGFEGLWDDVPSIAMPTTLVRGANSHFVNDEDAEAFATGRARLPTHPRRPRRRPLRAGRSARGTRRAPARGARRFDPVRLRSPRASQPIIRLP